MLAWTVAAGFAILPNATAQSLKPSKVINLTSVKITGSACTADFATGVASFQWIDDSRLLASTYWTRCDDAPTANPKEFETMAIIFNTRGAVLATARSHAYLYTKGPQGTVAALETGGVDLLDAQMHIDQTIPCPNASKACGISLSQSGTVDLDFALCSSSDQRTQVCDFYTGWPAKKAGRKDLPGGENPFTHAAYDTWRVSPGEIWLFKGGHLTSLKADGSQSLVNAANFVGDNGGNCNGELSVGSPSRFLATCVGSHWYSDGMFDNIFGFSHILLFDVSTKSIIGRVDGGAFVESALSPSGKKIAVLKGQKVRLYDVP